MQALAQAIDLAESEHTRLTLMTGVAELSPTAYLMAGEETGQLIENAPRAGRSDPAASARSGAR